jgi:hypothetical protein
MFVFDDKKNYSEVTLNKVDLNKTFEDTTKPLSQLPDGTYDAILYGYILELKDGRRYRCNYGVRHTRRTALPFRPITVKNGEVTDKGTVQFSGLGEMGGIMQGASYGAKPKQINKVTVDMKGFRIPEESMKPVTLDTKQYANVNNTGEYKGGLQAPSIGVTNDPTIIRRDNNNNIITPKQDSTQKPLEVTLGWNEKSPFNLGIEPWVTTPIMSDTDDGLYLGNVFGETFTTKSGDITMSIKLGIDTPEPVLGLVRGKKLFLFKQSQLLNSTDSKVFSLLFMDEKDHTVFYSTPEGKSEEIKSESEFRAYAHKLMKNAHGDNYSEEKTNKVVDDLISNNKDADFGELIGRLKSGLGNKNFSETSAWKYEFGTTVYPVEELDTDMSASLIPAVVGTVVMSSSYAHLLHLCVNNYHTHKTLEEYYSRMPYIVDKLAETYLRYTEGYVKFKNYAVPTNCPISYLTDVQVIVNKARKSEPSNSRFTSILDEINQLIDSTLYKLTRLKSGDAVFSMTREFSEGISRVMKGRRLEDMVDSITKSITDYARRYKKSPVKGIKNPNNDKEVRQYVKKSTLNADDFGELIGSLARSLSDAVTAMKFVR